MAAQGFRFLRSRLPVRLIQVALDLGVLSGAFFLAYLLRFEFAIPEEQLSHAAHLFPYVVLVQFAALALVGVYSFIWRFVGMEEIKSFLMAIFGSAVPMLLLRLTFPEGLYQWRLPLSVILMDTFLAFSGVVGLRVLRRALYERQEKRRRAAKWEKGLFSIWESRSAFWTWRSP